MGRAQARFFVISCCLAAFFHGFALAEAPAVGPKPQAILGSSSYDWGSVSQGTKVVRDFSLKNGGDAELVIQRIVPSCGCTATSTLSDRVPAGGETTLHVEVDTAGFAGKKERMVRLFTNDPDNPYTTVTLTGIVEPEVAIEPQRLSFPELIRGEIQEAPTLEFSVTVRPESKLEIKDITTYSKFLSIKELVSGPKERRVRVSLSPEVPTGEFRDRVVVGVSGGSVASMNVPVIASVKGKIQLKPSTLSFGVIQGSDAIVKKARLVNSGAGGLTIKKISSDNPAVTSQFVVVKPGKIFDIQVNVDPRKVNKDLRASLTIETDSATEGSLILSVYGILPPKD